MFEKEIAAAAKGITAAVLDKAVEMLREDVKAQDAKTDKGLFDRLKEKVKGIK